MVKQLANPTCLFCLEADNAFAEPAGAGGANPLYLLETCRGANHLNWHDTI